MIDPSQSMPDYLSPEDLIPWLDREVVEHLKRRTALVGLDGQPCWECERLAELLLLEQ
jgi:hypothetical protein